MLSWGLVAAVLAATGAAGAPHTVDYTVEVRGAAEVYVRYVDGDDRLVTEELAAPGWHRRVEVDSARTDEVRVFVAAAPSGPPPTLSCVLVVDGVERVRESAAETVECRFDLADLAPRSSSSAPAPPVPRAAEPPAAVGELVLWSAGGLAVVLFAVFAVRWRTRAPAPAAPGLEPEPHVRLVTMAGAVTLLLAVGGFFVACDAEPALPPSFDLDRELGEWSP